MTVDSAVFSERPIFVEGFGEVHITDIPINRAIYAGVNTFGDDEKKRFAFLWRYIQVFGIAREAAKFKKYRVVVGRQTSAMHPALIMAVCTVEGTMQTRQKELSAALWRELRKHLSEGIGVDSDSPRSELA